MNLKNPFFKKLTLKIKIFIIQFKNFVCKFLFWGRNKLNIYTIFFLLFLSFLNIEKFENKIYIRIGGENIYETIHLKC